MAHETPRENSIAVESLNFIKWREPQKKYYFTFNIL